MSVDASIDVERALLGAMLCDNKVSDEVLQAAPIEAFGKPEHRTIYQAIQTLRLLKHNVTTITVANELQAAGKLTDIGGQTYLATLCGEGVGKAVDYCIRRLLDEARARELLQGLETARDMAIQGNVDAAREMLQLTLASTAQAEAAATAEAAEAKRYAFEPGTNPDNLLTRYISWASMMTDAALEYHELSGLALISMAIHGTKAHFGPAPDGVGPCIYGLIIGDPGRSRKTTATGLARGIAERAFPGSITSNWHSPEGFVQELSEQTGKPVLLAIDEFGSYAEKLHHQKYMAGQMGLLLSAYTGEVLRYRRSKQKGQESEFVAEDVGLNILACCTPGALFGSLTLGDVQTGLLPRFAIAWPEVNPERVPFYQVSDPGETERSKLIIELTKLRQWAAAGRKANFDREALRLIDDLTEWTETAGSHDEALGSMVQRLPMMLVKTSMVVAAGRQGATNGNELVVTPDDVRQAQPILERWKNAAGRFAEELTSSYHERLVRRALAFVKDCGGRVTRTEVSQLLREPARTLDDVEQSLEERGYIVVLTRPGLSNTLGSKAGRSKKEWVLLKRT